MEYIEKDVPIVSMEKIVVRFGKIIALDKVDFSVKQHEIMALLGDNGAGKSTLIKALAGIYTPTEGKISFLGKEVKIRNPKDARNLGIETVYQDLALIELMSIARNFFLGREPIKRFGPIHFLDIKRMQKETYNSLLKIGIKVRSVNERVQKLSGGERQSIAISRAIYFGVKMLILDEPTTALSVVESRKVIEYIHTAKANGLSIIIIAHNIPQVMKVADRYTIIHQGKNFGTYSKDEVTELDITEMIAGSYKK